MNFSVRRDTHRFPHLLCSMIKGNCGTLDIEAGHSQPVPQAVSIYNRRERRGSRFVRLHEHYVVFPPLRPCNGLRYEIVQLPPYELNII